MFPPASTLQPGEHVALAPNIHYQLPTTSPRPIVLQHISTQTSPFHLLTSHKEQQTSPPLSPLRLHEDQQNSPSLTPLRLNRGQQTSPPRLLHFAQQTTPRPATCNTPSQTKLHSIALYPSFARPKEAANSVPSSFLTTGNKYVMPTMGQT